MEPLDSISIGSKGIGGKIVSETGQENEGRSRCELKIEVFSLLNKATSFVCDCRQQKFEGVRLGLAEPLDLKSAS